MFWLHMVRIIKIVYYSFNYLMFLTGIDVIQYSKVANGHRCHVRFMVYDDAGYIYITYISSNIYIILMNIYNKN